VKPPFFVVGVHRSGTTVLRLMLNAHPNLAVPFESAFIPEFYRRLEDYGGLSHQGNVKRLLDDIAEHPFVTRGGLIENPEAILRRGCASYAELVDAIFCEYARARGKSRWGDKTPGYDLEIPVLNTLFPSCQVIHIVRDGRDVALSLRGVQWGSRDLPRVAAEWRWRTATTHKLGAMLGRRFLEIRYEDLVLETEATLARVCAFLAEPFAEQMLDYAKTADNELPEASKESHQSALKPPIAGRVFAWRSAMSKQDQIIFGRVAAPALELFGYEQAPQVEDRFTRYTTRLKTIWYALRSF
jgi:hypothetical protein